MGGAGSPRARDPLRRARSAPGRLLSGAPAASLRGISKAFDPGRPVLEGVDLELRAGEIHSILGENGAGKSTLMNVLTGLVRLDAGSIAFDGRAVDAADYGPAQAARAGVGMVHQHSALVPAMSVVENLSFGARVEGFWFERRRALREAAERVRRFDLDVPLERRVEDLSVGQRQRAEILRALDRGARVLVLDEPTAVLTPGEIRPLFASLSLLRASGRAIAFISHKLDEVRAIADRVTVLRRGRVVASAAAAALDARQLGRLMLGRDLPPLERPPGPAPGAAAGAPALLEIRGLEAPGLSEAGRLRGIGLRVGPGEILGIVGIDGNGQRELEEVLAGVRRPSAGEIRVRGRRVEPGLGALRRAGLAHLSGERESAGLIPGLSVAENWILKGSYDDRRFFRRGLADRAAARAAAAAAIERFGIVPPDPDADIAALSGGNAQKLAVARELDADPCVLVAVNPTRGLDIASARFVHELLLGLRSAGRALLMISTELDEVLALADRVAALVRGELRPVPPDSDRAALGAILLGAGGSGA